MSNRILAFLQEDDAAVAHALPEIRRHLSHLESCLAHGSETSVNRERERVLESIGYLLNHACIMGKTHARFDRLWASLAIATPKAMVFCIEHIRAAIDELRVLTHRT